MNPWLFGGIIFIGTWISMMISTVNGASCPILVNILNILKITSISYFSFSIFLSISSLHISFFFLLIINFLYILHFSVIFYNFSLILNLGSSFFHYFLQNGYLIDFIFLFSITIYKRYFPLKVFIFFLLSFYIFNVSN